MEWSGELDTFWEIQGYQGAPVLTVVAAGWSSLLLTRAGYLGRSAITQHLEPQGLLRIPSQTDLCKIPNVRRNDE